MPKKTRVTAKGSSLFVALMLRTQRALLDLLDAHAACTNGLTEPDVHDLRLAVRRLQPVLEILLKMPGSKRRVGPLGAVVKELLQHSGAIRAAHVRVKDLQKQWRDDALWTALIGHARQEVTELADPFHAILERFSRKRVFKFLAKEWPSFAEEDARKALKQIVAKRRNRLGERIAELQPHKTRPLHQARVALKRYRYLLDAFAPYLPDQDQREQERMKELQARLGQWHDEAVFATWLERVAPELPAAVRKGCLALAKANAISSDKEHGVLVKELSKCNLKP
ncbi:MAG: CHAD domain-containing protein [Flavobacteriales bacterium]